MGEYSMQEYTDMLRGYLDSKRHLRPIQNGEAYLQGWHSGYKKQDHYQRAVNREVIA